MEWKMMFENKWHYPVMGVVVGLLFAGFSIGTVYFFKYTSWWLTITILSIIFGLIVSAIVYCDDKKLEEESQKKKKQKIRPIP